MTTPLKIESEVTFTPGPWKVLHRAGVSHVFTKTKLADVYSVVYKDEGNQHANARLIAAAPEMYEALKEMVERMECWSVGADIPVDIDSARAALAKAVKP